MRTFWQRASITGTDYLQSIKTLENDTKLIPRSHLISLWTGNEYGTSSFCHTSKRITLAVLCYIYGLPLYLAIDNPKFEPNDLEGDALAGGVSEGQFTPEDWWHLHEAAVDLEIPSLRQLTFQKLKASLQALSADVETESRKPYDTEAVSRFFVCVRCICKSIALLAFGRMMVTLAYG